uniref:ATP-dependent zinc metalloprotease FtsH homolog n=1 Tax=Oltmannsiellopsis viridis TaxID=51324 RepID=FTSHL_OLTVI|nr:cell division protein [Oltmannsiellopsis viridis]Q20EZ8.1 RecName: Full=ATP-dependent zinc metalloprotease FtsH homolog [Oltmannsiellopsis viridis]ABB82008.1 cell division protein [Oltmannsiellopsis viridis]
MTQLSSSQPIGETFTIWKFTFFKFYFGILDHREQTKNLFLNYSTKYISFEFLCCCFPFFIGLTQLVLLRYQNQFTSEVLQKTIPGLGSSYQPISWETFSYLNYKSYLSEGEAPHPFNKEGSLSKNSASSERREPNLMGLSPLYNTPQIDVYSDSIIITPPQKLDFSSAANSQSLLGWGDQQNPLIVGEIKSQKPTGYLSEVVEKKWILPSRNAVIFYKTNSSHGKDIQKLKIKKPLGSLRLEIFGRKSPYGLDLFPKKLNPIYAKLNPSTLPDGGKVSVGLFSESSARTGDSTVFKSTLNPAGVVKKEESKSLQGFLKLSKKNFDPLNYQQRTQVQQAVFDSLLYNQGLLVNNASRPIKLKPKANSFLDTTFDLIRSKKQKLSAKKTGGFAIPENSNKKVECSNSKLQNYNLLERYTLWKNYKAQTNERNTRAFNEQQSFLFDSNNGSVKKESNQYSTQAPQHGPSPNTPKGVLRDGSVGGGWKSLTKVHSLLTQWNYVQKRNNLTSRLMSGYNYPDVTNDGVKALNSSLTSFLSSGSRSPFGDTLRRPATNQSQRLSRMLPLKIHLPGNSTSAITYPVPATGWTTSPQHSFRSVGGNAFTDKLSRANDSQPAPQHLSPNTPKGVLRDGSVGGENQKEQEKQQNSGSLYQTTRGRSFGNPFSTQLVFLQRVLETDKNESQTDSEASSAMLRPQHFGSIGERSGLSQTTLNGGNQFKQTEGTLLNQIRKDSFTLSYQNAKKPTNWSRKTKAYVLLDCETNDLTPEQTLSTKPAFEGEALRPSDLKLWLKTYLSSDNPALKHKSTFFSTDTTKTPMLTELKATPDGRSTPKGSPEGARDLAISNQPSNTQKTKEKNSSHWSTEGRSTPSSLQVTKSLKVIETPTQTDANGQQIDLNRETRRWSIPGYQTWQIPLIDKHSSLFLLERLEPKLYKKITEFLTNDSKLSFNASQKVGPTGLPAEKEKVSERVLQESFTRNVLPLTEVRYPTNSVFMGNRNQSQNVLATENEYPASFFDLKSLSFFLENKTKKVNQSVVAEGHSVGRLVYNKKINFRSSPKINFHYLPVVEGPVYGATQNTLQVAGTYSKTTSVYKHLTTKSNQSSSTINQSRSEVPTNRVETWEPLTPFSWLIVTQLSFGLISLKVLQNLYQDYGKELISYVLDLLSIFGDSVEASLDESLKEEFQAQQDGSGARLIRKVDKRFQNLAGIQRILPECSEIVWFLRNYSFMKSSGLVYLSPVDRENRCVKDALHWIQDFPEHFSSTSLHIEEEGYPVDVISKNFAKGNKIVSTLQEGGTTKSNKIQFGHSKRYSLSLVSQNLTALALAPSNWLTFEKMIPKGILLVGPPGTGKTLLVQAIAGEANVPVLVQSLSLISQPGESDSGAEKLTDLFKRARELSPCIVFIDEIDTLGIKRQNLIQNPMGTDNLLNCLYPKNSGQQLSMTDGSKSSTVRTTTRLGKECPFPPHTTRSFGLDTNKDEMETRSSESTKASHESSNEMEVEKNQLSALIRLLVEMDGLNPLNGVIVFGATNRPEVLDPALIRPGRFDQILPIELPGKQKRVEILKLYAKKLGTAKSISWEYFANRTVGLSAADLAAIMNQSTILAVFNDQRHTLKTLEYGLNIIYKPKTGPILTKKVQGELNSSLADKSSNWTVDKKASTTSKSSLTSTPQHFHGSVGGEYPPKQVVVGTPGTTLLKQQLELEKNVLFKKGLEPKSQKLEIVTPIQQQSLVSEKLDLLKKKTYKKNISQLKLKTLNKLEKLSVQSLNTKTPQHFQGLMGGVSQREGNFTESLFSEKVTYTLSQLVQTWPKVLTSSKLKQKTPQYNEVLSSESLNKKIWVSSDTTHPYSVQKQFLTYVSVKKGFGSTLDVSMSLPELTVEKWLSSDSTYATDPFTLNRFGYYQSGKVLTQCLVEKIDSKTLEVSETSQSLKTDVSKSGLLNNKQKTSPSGLLFDSACNTLDSQTQQLKTPKLTHFTRLESYFDTAEATPVVLNLFPRFKNVRYQDESLRGKTEQKGNRSNPLSLASFEKQLISLLAGKASEILFFATRSVNVTKKGNSLHRGETGSQNSNFSASNWDSNLGVDLKFANKMANAMVNQWYFYSKKVLTRKTNQLALNHNTQEFNQKETIKFFQELTNQVENEMSYSVKAYKTGYFRNFQASSGKPWWQVKVAQQVGNLESAYTDWYRIYLPDTEESERNQEWTPPDQFFQNVERLARLNNKLENFTLDSEITWNDLGKMDRDFLYQSLLLNSFNQAFQVLDISRPLLDYFTDYLIRYEIMRQDTINKCLLNYEKFTDS